jgi:hypothetical protein
VGVKLVQEGMTTGGHTVFDPFTERLLKDFQVLKKRFDSIDRGTIELEPDDINSEGTSGPVVVAEAYQSDIIDGVVNLSR